LEALLRLLLSLESNLSLLALILGWYLRHGRRLLLLLRYTWVASVLSLQLRQAVARRLGDLLRRLAILRLAEAAGAVHLVQKAEDEEWELSLCEVAGKLECELFREDHVEQPRVKGGCTQISTLTYFRASNCNIHRRRSHIDSFTSQ
jgi:hypothetical protein